MREEAYSTDSKTLPNVLYLCTSLPVLKELAFVSWRFLNVLEVSILGGSVTADGYLPVY